MSIRNQVWTDLSDAKVAEEFLCLYLQGRRTRLKWYKIVGISLTSFGGVSGFSDYPIIPVIVLLVVSLAQIFAAIEGFFIPTTDELFNIEKLRMAHLRKLNDLLALWNEMNYLYLDHPTIVKRLSEIRIMDIEIQDLDNKYYINNKSKKMKKKAEEAANFYLNRLTYAE